MRERPALARVQRPPARLRPGGRILLVQPDDAIVHRLLGQGDERRHGLLELVAVAEQGKLARNRRRDLIEPARRALLDLGAQR
jgi:hypothetical protein